MNIVLLTAGGTGKRAALGTPKQFYEVEGKPLIVYTMEAFERHPEIDALAAVVLAGYEERIRALATQYGISKLRCVTTGGESGQCSIYRGLQAIRPMMSDEGAVLIHDGNRPLVSREIISDSLRVWRQYGSAVAAIPCAEAIFVTENGAIRRSIPRETLVRTQTPHTFSFGKLWELYAEAERRGIHDAITACSLNEQLYGEEMALSRGEDTNIKITVAEDIRLFRALLHTKGD